MYKIIELDKNNLFCDICGKRYIYKGSYEKHKLICNKNEVINYLDYGNVTEENIIINNFLNEENDIDYKNENREKINYKILSNDEIIEIICPFYLFFCSLFLELIKILFYG